MIRVYQIVFGAREESLAASLSGSLAPSSWFVIAFLHLLVRPVVRFRLTLST
jgi:hypothetical protein